MGRKLRMLERKFYSWLYRYSRSKYRKHLTAMFDNEVKFTYSQGLKVSDHAIARYYERIENKDHKALADKITNGLKSRVISQGDGKYIVGDMRVTVVGKWVKTIDSDTDPTNNKSRIITNKIRGLEKLLVKKDS